MNCDRCPHMLQIRSALAPCQKCEAGQIHHQKSLDSGNRVSKICVVERHTSQSDCVTWLSPSTEDKLRIALATIFAFDPVQLLLIRHMMLGGSYASFRMTLHDLYARLSRYRLDASNVGFRSLAKTWSDSIVKKLPAIKKLFDAAIDANRGEHSKKFS